MNGGEKVLSILIAILVVLVVVLSVSLLNTKEEIGEVEAERNRIHKAKIAAYENQIDLLYGKIVILQSERDSLQGVKAKIRIVTIHEIDSVSRLPFPQQSDFFTRELVRLDSIRRRYFSHSDQ